MPPDVPSFRAAGLGHWLARQLTSSSYINSPTQIVDETNEQFRRRLGRPFALPAGQPVAEACGAEGGHIRRHGTAEM